MPQLYATSDTVVVASLADSRGYWAKNDGQAPENWTVSEWSPLTVTNFHVDRVLKGSVGAWLQIIDKGANPDNIATCPNRVTTLDGWPLPATAQVQYVVFLQGGREGYGPSDRWPIIGGVVHPDRDMQAGASDLIAAQPMELDAFIAAMQR